MNTMKLISVSIILILFGCINLRHDVSNDEKAWFPYSTKNVYVTREAIFLIKVDSGLEPERLALVPPSDSKRGSGFYSSPKSIQDYNENPNEACRSNLGEEFRINVIGIVEIGTEFIPVKVKRNSGWNIWFGNHTYDTRYGKIVSGQYKGTIVDIEDVSWCMEEGPILNRYIEI
ncbi:MAG: hypothetical protein P8016_16615 [Sedimentisphaerales bacterium]